MGSTEFAYGFPAKSVVVGALQPVIAVREDAQTPHLVPLFPYRPGPDGFDRAVAVTILCSGAHQAQTAPGCDV